VRPFPGPTRQALVMLRLVTQVTPFSRSQGTNTDDARTLGTKDMDCGGGLP
jgi:hypothetical protein